MSEYRHAKVTKTTTQDDGTDLITTQSYYEKLSAERVEIEKKSYCTRQAILKELIDATALISEGALELSLTIRPSKNDNVRIIKRWTITQEQYGSR